MKTRFTSIFPKAAITLLLMLLTGISAWAQEEIDGLTYNSEGGYYEIPNAAALVAFSNYAQDNDCSDKTFKLTADIDFANEPLNTDSNGYPYNFTPIGFDGEAFSGKFYGNGHTISNLEYTANPTVSGRGLFGKTEGATLDGITISGFKLSGTASYAGGLVGNAVGTHISDCHVDCTINNSSSHTGGLAGGISEGTTIDGCSSQGTVSSTSSNTGGLVGYCGEGTCTIRNSTTDVDVTGTESTGGFFGRVDEGNLNISDCRVDGFTGGSGKVGGFVGSIGVIINGNNSTSSSGGTVTISNCAARGDVRSYAPSYGGFIGELTNSTVTLSDCWCSGAVWGTGGDIGAFVGKCTKGKLQDCASYPYANGTRYFCGSNINIKGDTLSVTDVAELSKDKDGTPWPKVQKHIRNAMPIATAEDLYALAITTNADSLAGCYVLMADIDLNGRSIKPIGTNTKAFSGEFYGQGHQIISFILEDPQADTGNSNQSVTQYMGFFGNIHGGRVNNLRLEGTVSYSGVDPVCLGGFAGEIQSKSLVDDCMFLGEIECKENGKVGGFVGQTEDSPMILRSCVGNARIWNESSPSSTSSQPYTGGFVGLHNNGFIKDCYAVADVSSEKYAGGFAGYVAASARIATSWCSGEVIQGGSWIGAFVGHIDNNGVSRYQLENKPDSVVYYVTDSYYNSSVNGDLLARGTGPIYGYDNCPGITGLDDMSDPNSFVGFDFDTTWEIDDLEGHPVFRRWSPAPWEGTITIEMNASGIMTYASNTTLDFSNVDGLTAYIVSDFDGDNGTLTLTPVGEVSAATGLLLKGTASTQFTIPANGCATAPATNYLVGVTDGSTVVPMTTATNTNFILANGDYGIDWYTLSEAGAIGANKAYLSLPTASLNLSGSRGFTWVYDDGSTTALNEELRMKNEECSPAAEWYTLDGRKLSAKPTTKGLYIHNGKKVVIK